MRELVTLSIATAVLARVELRGGAGNCRFCRIG